MKSIPAHIWRWSQGRQISSRPAWLWRLHRWLDRRHQLQHPPPQLTSLQRHKHAHTSIKWSHKLRMDIIKIRKVTGETALTEKKRALSSFVHFMHSTKTWKNIKKQKIAQQTELPRFTKCSKGHITNDCLFLWQWICSAGLSFCFHWCYCQDVPPERPHRQTRWNQEHGWTASG